MRGTLSVWIALGSPALRWASSEARGPRFGGISNASVPPVRAILSALSATASTSTTTSTSTAKTHSSHRINELLGSDERQLQINLGSLGQVVTTSTTTVWPTPIMESEDTTRCIMNNFEGYNQCMGACVRGGARVNDYYPWTQNDSITNNITLLIGGQAEWERRKAEGTEKGTPAWRFFNRVGLMMKDCDFLFTTCDAKCADCVDCRRGKDRDLCNAYLDEFQENEEFSCLIGYHGCGSMCPRKYLYPRCITCCKCLDWDVTTAGLRQKAAQEAYVYARADTIDAEDVYVQASIATTQPPLLPSPVRDWWTSVPIIEATVAIVLAIGVLIMLKKGGLNDISNKTEQVSFKSTRTGKIYKGASDYAKDDLGPARSFKQDEDAPIPKLPEVRPPPTPRVETPRQIVATNWEDMVEADRAARIAGVPALPEEANKDIPVCLLYLEGKCRRGHACHYRHDNENLFPQTIGVLALPGTAEPPLSERSTAGSTSTHGRKKPGRSIQPRKF